DSSAVRVTTMLDYYGLPKDFPGATSLPPTADCYRRVDHLENALRDDIQNPRFLPYLSLHEFEAILFVAPQLIATAVEENGVAERLAACSSSPEEVNDGPDIYPAARILAVAPRYRKILHGLLIAGRIGLSSIRERCWYFHSWVSKLEGLGAG